MMSKNFSRGKNHAKLNHTEDNSYVAHEPLQEIQIDIADFTRSADVNDGFRYLFVAVDIFTKICHAVPIKDKEPE